MSVRPFDWRDVATLHRYRNESVFLDTALLLTRGPLMMPGAVFSYLAPSMGVFTCVSSHKGSNGKDSSSPVIGQFMHMLGSPFAHITFFAPQSRLDGTCISAQVEYMLMQLGERGAMRLLADVDEGSFANDALREVGFATYTRQRVWQWTGNPQEVTQKATWRLAASQDVIPIRVLYNNLVPGLVQQIEPFATQRPRGMVYYEQGELLAYVELKYGHRGIWVQPFVHPDAEDVTTRCLDLLSKIPNRRSRPVYICVRSYQAWLESAIEDLGAEAGPRQAVMCKQLMVQSKVRATFAIPALEGGQPEIPAPVVRLETK